MKRILLYFIFFSICCLGFAQPRHGGRTVPQKFQKTAATFTADSLEMRDFVLKYCIKQYGQSISGSAKPCIFVYLHGGGGRRASDMRYIQNQPIYTLDGYIRKQALEAIVLAPKCPKDEDWSTISVEVKHLIDQIVSEYGADPSRIYLIGTSFGGHGGWWLLSEYPELFAAAQLGSAVPRRYVPEDVARTPVYFTMGEFDRSSPKDCEIPIAELRSLGADVEFHVLKGEDHRGACDKAITKKSIEFLLSHSR